MEDREILQAILDKVTSMDTRLSTVEGDLSEVKADLSEVKERTTKIEVTLENDIKTQLQLLGEGQQGMNEKFAKLDKVAEDVEEIKIKVSALANVTKDNTAQIKDIRIAK